MNFNKSFYELGEEEYDDMNIAEWYDIYKKYHKLEEEIGCPVEVRCKIYNGLEVFVEITYWDSLDEEDKIEIVPQTVSTVFSNRFSTLSGKQCYWKEYKKTWWLKADRSE